jgi:hypothetical protein
MPETNLLDPHLTRGAMPRAEVAAPMPEGSNPDDLIGLRAKAKKELLRFFALATRAAEGLLIMPSVFMGKKPNLVDAIWHEELEKSPEEYEALCIEACGEPLRHDKDVGDVHWGEQYERTYGELPEVWFCDPSGALDMVALMHYRATRRFRHARIRPKG